METILFILGILAIAYVAIVVLLMLFYVGLLIRLAWMGLRGY